MKNVTKKLAGIALLLLVAFALAGCSDLTDAKNDSAGTDSSAKTCTVSGKVSVGRASGATSSNFLANLAPAASESARSATSSLPTSDVSFSVYAYKGSGSSINTSVKVDGTFNSTEMTYSVALPQIGDWTIYVVGGGQFLEGNAAVTVTDDYTDIPETAIILQPGYSTADNGAISLTIGDGTTDSKIKSVTFSGTVLTTDTSNANSLSAENLDDKATVSFSGGSATIALEDIKPNAYEVTFSFYDDAGGEGNLLYKCKEVIEVYGGFTTDTWFGEGSHLVNSGDTVEFVITDSLVSSFGTEIVPNTDLMIPSFSNYYHIAEDELATLTTNSTRLDLISKPCFDSNGNYYYLDENKELKSNNTNANDKTLDTSDNYSNSLIVDMATDILYLYYINESQLYVYKYPDLISNGTVDTKYTCTFGCESFTVSVSVDGSDYTSSPWPSYNVVVYDGTIYVIGADTSSSTPGSYLYHGTFEDGLEEKTLSDKVALNLESLGDTAPSVNDILYQDGKVYMLLNDGGNDSNEVRSRGGVLIYDCFSGKVSSKIIGWTDGYVFGSGSSSTCTPIESLKTNATYNEKLLYEKISENGTETYQNLQLTFTTADTTGMPYQFYCPYDSLDSYFAGPRKFVGIKPKKLVVMDHGIAFYTDDDVLKYKRVDRVVYVDLESFSITDSVPVTTVYASSWTEPGSTNFFKQADADATYYNNDGSEEYSVSQNDSYGASFVSNQ